MAWFSVAIQASSLLCAPSHGHTHIHALTQIHIQNDKPTQAPGDRLSPLVSVVQADLD